MRADGGRLALALPVGSTRRILAATRVVVLLLAAVGRTELDLLRRPARLRADHGRAERAAILFVATTFTVAADDAQALGRLERWVRAQIEEQYARQGIVPVEYDLQLL